MLKNEKQQKMPEKTETNAGKKLKKCWKTMTQYRTTPTSILIQNYFFENLTQYTIHTLIGV